MKENPYTGKRYTCKCDYSYTCEECRAVREEFSRREKQASDAQWILDSIQRIAEHIGLELPPRR
jgi:hypothetical protein